MICFCLSGCSFWWTPSLESGHSFICSWGVQGFRSCRSDWNGNGGPELGSAQVEVGLCNVHVAMTRLRRRGGVELWVSHPGKSYGLPGEAFIGCLSHIGIRDTNEFMFRIISVLGLKKNLKVEVFLKT